MRGSDPKTNLQRAVLLTALALTLVPQSPLAAGDVDSARLRAADSEPQNWFTLGRDQNQTYYSPLAKIDASNVSRLGFAWAYDLGTARGQEATPIVVDGAMYTSGTWGYVYALDAATGKELWKFDPRADPRAARNPCCDLVNRGVAVWKGKVFVASVDGRLHALDATTGKELWSADTIVDHKLPYSSTGAVYIAGDLAVIGNSGADMDKGGVRGYVSAYDVETGKLAWRFYTVPGAPGQPPEDPAMALAAKTWNRHRAPEYKGGGTVWDGFAYDSDLKLVYFGTANAAPYDLRLIGGKPMDAPVHRFHCGAACGYRPPRLVLPDDAGRPLGLRCRAEAHPGRSQDRRLDAPRHHAGEQERLLLRPRPPDGQIDLGQELHLRELGLGHRHEDWAAPSHQAGQLVFRTEDRLSFLGRRAQLAAHVLQPEDGSRLYPGHRCAQRLGRSAA